MIYRHNRISSEISSYFDIGLVKTNWKGTSLSPTCFTWSRSAFWAFFIVQVFMESAIAIFPQEKVEIWFLVKFSASYCTCCFSCTTDMISSSSAPAFFSPWFQAWEMCCSAPALSDDNHRSRIHALVSVICPAMWWAQCIGSRKHWGHLSAAEVSPLCGHM